MLDQLALYLISSSFNCFLSHSFPTGGHPTCYRIIPKVAPAYQGFPQEFYFICKHCLCCQVWRHRLPVSSGAADPFHWLHISLGAMTHARLIPYEIWSVVGELHCPCRDRHSQCFWDVLHTHAEHQPPLLRRSSVHMWTYLTLCFLEQAASIFTKYCSLR